MNLSWHNEGHPVRIIGEMLVGFFIIVPIMMVCLFLRGLRGMRGENSMPTLKFEPQLRKVCRSCGHEECLPIGDAEDCPECEEGLPCKAQKEREMHDLWNNQDIGQVRPYMHSS